MASSVPLRRFAMEDDEVDAVDPGSRDTVNKVDRLADVPLQMAKMRAGACIGAAIGTAPLKQFGDKGLVSNVISGERVPEYLARIYSDDDARLRFALALLEGDGRVEVTTTITIRERKAE